MRYRIRHRHNRLEPEDAVRVGTHHRALIRSLTARVLHIVETLGVGFPDVDLDVRDRLAIGVFDTAENEAGLAVWIVRDLGAVGLALGLVGVEGSQNCAFGACRRLRVVDAVD